MRDPYLYEDVAVLRNKLDIRQQELLDEAGGGLCCIPFKGSGIESVAGRLPYSTFFENA